MMAESFRKKLENLAISQDLSFSHSKKFLLNFPQTKALLLGNMLKVTVFNYKFNKITPVLETMKSVLLILL